MSTVSAAINFLSSRFFFQLIEHQLHIRFIYRFMYKWVNFSVELLIYN